MLPWLLPVWILASLHGPAACQQKVSEHVQDPRLRAALRSYCLQKGGDVVSWLDPLVDAEPFPEEIARSAEQDPDWRVRWRVALLRARRAGAGPRRAVELAAGAPSGAGCQTALRGGATAGGEALREALRLCEPARAEVKARLEVELYDADPALQKEALAQLARLEGLPPARVLLRAMATRPATVDQIPADLLLAFAAGSKASVASLLSSARAPEQDAVNRLLARYSARIDELRPALEGKDPAQRREALQALAAFLPWSAPEVEARVQDADASVRWAAASVLAQSEGKEVAAYVVERARAWPGGSASPALQAAWIRAVTGRAGRECLQALRAIGRDVRQRPDIRARAYEGVPDCQGDPRAALLEGARAQDAAVRAAALRALAQAARFADGRKIALASLADARPEVAAGAARALGTQGRQEDVNALAPLLSSADPLAREAAADAMGKLGAAPQRALLRQALLADESLPVRVAAAHALEKMGGPFAVSALAEAEANDPAPYVRHVAQQALRNLGFRR